VDRQEQAFIGLGANIGQGQRTLEAAIAALRALPDARLDGVSRLYRTRPVGPVAQDDFWNAVAALSVPAGPTPAAGAVDLLLALKWLERSFGRQASERWGPRELDLDLLLFGDHRVHLERPPAARSDDPARPGIQWLEVPHPHAVQRAFVLAPLADLAPDLEPPGWGMSVGWAWQAARAREGDGAVRAVADWDATRRCWVGPGAA
jgi:2-amino-4-hydroxy-6-hydroxymethyldihydropteridine diphosphokinase